MYTESNRLIEKWIPIFHFAMGKVTPVSFILPIFSHSIFIYFTSNLGNDCLELPLPIWFVWSVIYLKFHRIAHLQNYTINLFIQKVSIQYKESHRIFSCSHNRIYTGFSWIVHRSEFNIVYNWIFLGHTFIMQRDK